MTRCRKRKQALDPKGQNFRALNGKQSFWRMNIFRCCISCTISHQRNANGLKVYNFWIFESFVNKSAATAVKISGGCIPPETHGQASRTLIEGNLEIDKIDIWKCLVAGISNPFHFFMRPSAYNLDSRELKLLLWKFVFAAPPRLPLEDFTAESLLTLSCLSFSYLGQSAFNEDFQGNLFFSEVIESHSY